MQYHKIAIGAVQFGLDYGISNKTGQTGLDEIEKIFKTSKKYKINTLDTSDAYGNSEEVIGQVAGEEWLIISKFSSMVLNVGLHNLLQQSLNKLQRTSIEGYLAHDAETLINNPTLWDDLLDCRVNGQVKKIGYSIYTPKQLESLLSMNMIPDIIQVPFNFLDRRFYPYFDQLKNLKVEIHTRSSFLQGLFFIKAKNLSSFFEPVQKLIDELQKTFISTDKLANALLKYCLDIDQIDKVIIGVNTNKQLLGNLSNMNNVATNLSQFEYLAETIHLKDELLLPYMWPQKTHQ